MSARARGTPFQLSCSKICNPIIPENLWKCKHLPEKICGNFVRFDGSMGGDGADGDARGVLCQLGQGIQPPRLGRFGDFDPKDCLAAGRGTAGLRDCFWGDQLLMLRPGGGAAYCVFNSEIIHGGSNKKAQKILPFIGDLWYTALRSQSSAGSVGKRFPRNRSAMGFCCVAY